MSTHLKTWLAFPFVLLCVGVSTAATITPFASLTAGAANCTLRDGSHSDCSVQSYLSANPADLFTAFISPDTFFADPTAIEGFTFATGFSTWNSDSTTKWKLINGGTLNINLFVLLTTSVDNSKATGGSTINIIPTAYTPGPNDPAANQLVWTQAVLANFQPGKTTQAVRNTLDTFTTTSRAGTCTALPGPPNANNNITPSTVPSNAPPSTVPGYCDPIYPLQQTPAKDVNVNVFPDAPAAFFAGQSFRAVALLSTITIKTDGSGAVTERDLTVYDGVSYGFDTFAPEPGTLGPIMLALPALVWGLRRKRKGSMRKTKVTRSSPGPQGCSLPFLIRVHLCSSVANSVFLRHRCTRIAATAPTSSRPKSPCSSVRSLPA
jgi:hypothetical protein